MWIPRKKLKTLVQRMNDLEKQISSLEKDSQDWKLVRLKTELNYEFCKINYLHSVDNLTFCFYNKFINRIDAGNEAQGDSLSIPWAFHILRIITIER